jgi:hypothetical protein
MLRDELKNRANLTTLDRGAGYLAVINTYAVAPCNVPRRFWNC